MTAAKVVLSAEYPRVGDTPSIYYYYHYDNYSVGLCSDWINSLGNSLLARQIKGTREASGLVPAACLHHVPQMVTLTIC